jgi:hypothetical protein
MDEITYRDADRRKVCHAHHLRKLKKLGYKTDGDEKSLESIITSAGFKLPGFVVEKTKAFNDDGDVVDDERIQYGFMCEGRIWVYYNYADSLAGEIIVLNELKLFPNGENGD